MAVRRKIRESRSKNRKAKASDGEEPTPSSEREGARSAPPDEPPDEPPDGEETDEVDEDHADATDDHADEVEEDEPDRADDDDALDDDDEELDEDDEELDEHDEERAVASHDSDGPVSLDDSDVSSVSSLPPASDPSYELGALVARSFHPGQRPEETSGRPVPADLEDIVDDEGPFRLVRSKPPAPPRPPMRTLRPGELPDAEHGEGKGTEHEKKPTSETPSRKEAVTAIMNEDGAMGVAAMADSILPPKKSSRPPGGSRPPRAARAVGTAPPPPRPPTQTRGTESQVRPWHRDVALFAAGVVVTLLIQRLSPTPGAPPQPLPVAESDQRTTQPMQPGEAKPGDAPVGNAPTSTSGAPTAEPDDTASTPDEADSAAPAMPSALSSSALWPSERPGDEPSAKPSAEPAPEPSASAAEEPEDPPEAPPFDRAAAKAALGGAAGAASGCGKGEVSGVAQVSVTFANSGRVTAAMVSGSLAGTPAGSCVARAMRSAKVPAYSGPIVTVMKRVSVK